MSSKKEEDNHEIVKFRRSRSNSNVNQKDDNEENSLKKSKSIEKTADNPIRRVKSTEDPFVEDNLQAATNFFRKSKSIEKNDPDKFIN